ncbi:cytochrome c biogenesis protein CcmE [Klebsiella pneumoniae]|uniref:Cytochrome c-type biogenesis protein CcmE n=1 Tax=Klebsiella pneumoniae TaxID=573 RepID=A0A5C2LK22_KLEPN|nr:cytochrome c biogenesis protein CcmE [Klebsiella pneumoniae]
MRCDASRRASGGSLPPANMTRRPRMQARRKTRLYIVLAVLAGLGLTVSLTLYALSSNIDLFYTRGNYLRQNGNPGATPYRAAPAGGGYVQPGSLQRDPQTLDVRFKLYDARGVVDVSYKGILPDLFREGQGVVARGVLDGERHITAQQVLAKHDENYTPPEVKNAMTPEKTGTQP